MPSHLLSARMSYRVRNALGAALLLCAGLAGAGEAGRIVFVSGEVRNGARAVAQGDVVQEGESLRTGADGYTYLKTIDDGLLILRPNSHARIVAYHVDRAHPENTRVKLELLSGVARSVSGTAVKQARQNFRFNTPVAAIGVRGTDFTVSTSQETSNVTVLSGAIVVSGFGGACVPGGAGPCEHAASRELAAGQGGQMLQVRRGLTTPQLLNNNSQAPDSVAPPRGDEPIAKSGTAASQPLSANEPSLDAQKSSAVLQQGLVRVAILPPVTPPVEPPAVAPVNPPVVAPELPVTPPVVVPELPSTPDPQPAAASVQLSWGRWQAVSGVAATIDNVAQANGGAESVAKNSYYSIFRSKSGDWQTPVQGSVGFSLRQSDAFVLNEVTQQVSNAKLDNGQLQVDFGKATFTTGFDLTTQNDTFKMRSTGVVTRDGLMSGGLPYITNSNMAVSGALGSENNAAYIFSGRLDEKRVANGVTYWTK